MTRFARQVGASLRKEGRTLLRDRGGLIVLFAMPAALVLVVTVVQERTMRFVSAPNASLLLIDRDGGELGAALKEGLLAAGVFTVETGIEGRVPTEAEAKAAVARGMFQAALVLPEGASAAARDKANRLAEGLLAVASSGVPPATEAAPASRLSVWLDPVLTEPYVKLIRNVSMGVVRGVEMRLVVEAFAKGMLAKAAGRPGAALPEFLSKGLAAAPMADGPATLLALDAAAATDRGWADVPDSVQQNVPAWTIFAMFLIVIPLAGGLIRERREGTATRLRVIPGAPAASLMGKSLLFLGVCLAQFALMLAIGTFVLPAFGTPAFHPGPVLAQAFVVGLVTAAAAVGFGMAVGMVAGTPEQASVFGASAVVILGALGGVMIPRFTMPEAMRALAVVSPLGWAQEAFLGLFLRGGDLASVLPWIARLMAFAAAGMVVALTFQRRRG